MAVSIEQFIKDMKLQLIYDGDKSEIDFLAADINRPGLQLTGFFDYFAHSRVQVLGMAEMTYLDKLSIDERLSSLRRLMAYEIPCLICAHGTQPHPEMKQAALEYKRPLFSTDTLTTAFQHMLMSYLTNILAPTITTHGVLLDVYGVGIMLIGESGIGKSETALELIKRGHRLVADDAVFIKKVSDDRLVGEAPEIIRHLMEIRGIGIIDIKSMYGIGAVINSKTVDIAIQLEHWKDDKEYDRLGLSDEKMDILGVKIPKLIIPVRPGRNLAIIMETAARNYRLKAVGKSAAEEFATKIELMYGEE